MTSISKKVIGGEQDLVSNYLSYGVTNSGRSSLRWILYSMGLQGKRVMLPDFLCQVIVDVVKELNIDIVFYKINIDLSYDFLDKVETVDAIYIIKFFGDDSASFTKAISATKSKLIIDDVFGTDSPISILSNHWCYFNSLRKISYVADYSQVVSNKPLADVNKKNLISFSKNKYLAKYEKYNFINGLSVDESYLSRSQAAEMLLDASNDIYQPSETSLYYVTKFYQSIREETSARLLNLNIAKETLNNGSYLNINPSFPSFLPVILNNRDEVRKILFLDNIYLAVHWPVTEDSYNELSHKLLSIPLDSRYSVDDIKIICDLVNKHSS